MKEDVILTNKSLFELIDEAYQEYLSNQPKEYKKGLLESAQELKSGTSGLDVCLKIYQLYHDNFIVPMTLPKKNRVLYQFVKDKLNNLDQKTMRDVNLGYGLGATHFTFGPLN